LKTRWKAAVNSASRGWFWALTSRRGTMGERGEKMIGWGGRRG
jgi:hypothetical protein